MYKPILTIAAGTLLAASAHASVVYNWHPVHNTEHIKTHAALDEYLPSTLEVSDAAWRSGHLNEYWDKQESQDPQQWPGKTFKDIGIAINDTFRGTHPGGKIPIVERPDDYMDAGHLNFDASLTFGPDGQITDSFLFYANTDSSIRMASDQDGLWGISYLAGDGLTPADNSVPGLGSRDYDDISCPDEGVATNCYYKGATGRWVLDSSTIPTPEPGTLALFGLSVGLLGLGVRRRLKG